ncbi:hypothetical protein M3C58_13560, partial [Brachybacterium muris]|nr:hypothetical protein [Brachybacterium muris]
MLAGTAGVGALGVGA